MWDAATATPVFNIGYVTPPPPIRSSEKQPLPPSPQPPSPPLPSSQSSSLPSGVTLARPHTEPQGVSGRTRSKTVKPSDQRLHHSLGLLSRMTKTELLSMVTTRGAVDAGRRIKPPSFGGRGQPSFSVGDRDEAPPVGGNRGIPCAMAAMLATREDIQVTLGDQRPPYKPPDLPHCCASDLTVPRSHKEAMRSEHAHLWKDSAGREFYGLPDAGTFEPA